MLNVQVSEDTELLELVVLYVQDILGIAVIDTEDDTLHIVQVSHDTELFESVELYSRDS